METEKSEERTKHLQAIEIDIQSWMTSNGLNNETKNEIKEIVKRESDKFKDADMENILSILPPQSRKKLKRFLCMKALSKALKMEGLALKGVKAMEKEPGEENKDAIQEKVLTKICDYLKPVIYSDGRYVYRIGEPLDRMLLITDGFMWTYNTTSISTSQDEGQGTGSTCLGKDAFYGDELLNWAYGSRKSLDNLPVLKANAKAHGKVEGFILMAKDLDVVVDKCKNLMLFHDPKVREEEACKFIQKIYRNHRQFKQQPKKDQQKVLQSDPPKVPDGPPKPAVMTPQPEAAVVLEISSEDTATASSQVP